MSTAYGEGLEQIIAEYRERRAGIGEMQRKLGEVSGTATAPRQVVTVTVGSQGEIAELKFPTSAYRRMTPVELAATLKNTINEARDKAMEKTAEVLSPMLPPGLVARDLVSGKADLSAILPEEPEVRHG